MILFNSYNLLQKIFTPLISAFFGALICFFYFHYYPKTEIKIVEVTKVVSAPVKRDYIKMSDGDLFNNLWHYDNDSWKSSYKQIDPNTWRVSWKLHERDGYQDIKIECASSSNFKMYLAVAGAACLVGGYVVYKLTK